MTGARLPFLLLAAVNAVLTVKDLSTGSAVTLRPRSVRRADNPKLYWLVILLMVALTGACLLGAFVL